jgi:hypothetical protein
MAKADHLAKHRFRPGGPPGPGRPRGSRSRLQEFVLRALAEDFERYGSQVIETVRQKRPEVYLNACVSLLPRQQEKLESPFSDISDNELQELEGHLAMLRARTVRKLQRLEKLNGVVVTEEEITNKFTVEAEKAAVTKEK